MDDLHGNPLPTPKPARPLPDTNPPTQRRTAADRAKDKKLDRSAAYYEHVAPPAQELESSWRHSHWKIKRELVRGGLARTGSTPTQLHNFDNCGSGCSCQWSEFLQKRRLSAFYCHNRHCEPCARAKANRIAANLKDKLKAAGKHDYRLITLTLRHTQGESLADQIHRLYACFKRLRKTREWKATQTGGAAVLEVKYVTGWHAHLHIVSQGTFLSQSTLSELWHHITKNSFIVDVRSIYKHEDAAAYVCKYITKSTTDSVWSETDHADEWIMASRGLRTAFTFGSWRKYPLTKVVKKATDWQHEDTLCNLVKRAAAGELVAVHILNDLRRAGGGLDEHQARVYLEPKPEPFSVDDLPSPDG